LAEIIEDIVIQHESFASGTVTLEMSEPLPETVSLPVKIALCRILQESLAKERSLRDDYFTTENTRKTF
jgi:hypothetical protein